MATWKKVITDGADLSDIGTPASDDKLLIQDTSDSNVVKYVDWADVGGDTSLSDTDQTLTGARVINTNGYDFTIKNGTSNLLFWDVSAGAWTFSEEVLFKNNSGFTAGEIRLNEDPISGSNYIALRAPDSMSANLSLELPATDGTSGQALVTDGSGNLSFATVGGGSDTHLGNANLTADNNRTYNASGNSLTFDVNGGDLTISDSNASDTYLVAGSNVLTLGDSGMTVKSNGIIQAEFGIEQDEANLTTLGDFGAGCDITYMGSSATAVSQGRVYYWSGATWVAYTSATETPQKALLGIALGTTMSKGFLLKGFIHPDSGTLTAGTQVFGATNASVVSTAPTTGFQRIIGHSISSSVIYFNPSSEYIDLA